MLSVGRRCLERRREGGVLIGAETRRALPDGSLVEALPDLRVKGKQDLVEAYLLHALPSSR